MAGLGTQNQKRQRGASSVKQGLNSDPPISFCACSTENGPHETKMVHMGRLWLGGSGDVTTQHN
jgi:hypothetical protein